MDNRIPTTKMKHLDKDTFLAPDALQSTYSGRLDGPFTAGEKAKFSELNEGLRNDAEREDMKKRLSYPALDTQEFKRFDVIDEAALALAVRILEHCPRSQERTTALRKVEEAIMWATASLARYT